MRYDTKSSLFFSSSASLDLDGSDFPVQKHTIFITAEDAGVPFSLASNTTLEINITAVNEFSPIFTVADNKVILVDEDISVGSVIYKVRATDSDYGLDGEIEYDITAGNPGKFIIDSVTGNISISSALDRETQDIYHLIVRATDKSTTDKRFATLNVHVNVKDINDNVPVFAGNPYYKSVNETVPKGYQVLDVHATDQDAGTNGELKYSIVSGNELGYFAIQPNLGVILVDKILDLETQNHSDNLAYHLVVLVTDKGTPNVLNSYANVTVEVKSANEFSPVVFPAGQQIVEVREDTPVSSLVFDVNATDKDYGDDGKLTYSITQGNTLGKFSIDSATGKFKKLTQHNTVSQPVRYVQRTKLHLVLLASYSVWLGEFFFFFFSYLYTRPCIETLSN